MKSEARPNADEGENGFNKSKHSFTFSMSTAQLMSWRVFHVLQHFPSVNMSKAITIMCVVGINVNKCVFGRVQRKERVEKKRFDVVIKNRIEHVFRRQSKGPI